MRVLLDTCVLYPPSVRDLLLGLAAEDAFQVRISTGVLAELEEVLVRQATLTHEVAGRRVAEIRNVGETLGALHSSDRDATSIGRTIGLPDDDDAHLVDAALSADCDAILTFNLSDLPERCLAAVGLEAWHPDWVLEEMARERHPALVRAASDLLSRIRVYERPSDIALKIAEAGLPNTGGRMLGAGFVAAVETHGRGGPN